MLAIYIRSTGWLTRQRDKVRFSDRGAVSVEAAILIGVLGGAALIVAAAVTTWVNNRVGLWQD